MLKDGSDSVGALGALNRVYLNIGLFSEEWLLHFRAVIGGKPITPIPIATARKNSVYWRATEMQTPDMARFFLASTDPHHLKDAPGAAAQYLTDEAAALARGKDVFAERCARCHSSKLPPLPAGLDLENANGPDYLTAWNQYWAWTKTDAFKAPMRQIVMRRRLPRRTTSCRPSCACRSRCCGINACSPLATNAIAGNIWDNFSSQSYKQLPAGRHRSRSVTRSPAPSTTIRCRAAAAASSVRRRSSASGRPRRSSRTTRVGPSSASPSVEARMQSFQTSIEQMLWPERRQKDALFANETGPGVGIIDRITVDSYLEVAGELHPGLPAAVRRDRPTAVSVHHRRRLLDQDRSLSQGHARRAHHQHGHARFGADSGRTGGTPEEDPSPLTAGRKTS